MSNISDLLSGSTGQTLIDGISNQLGIKESDTNQVLGSAIPLILGALKNNTNNSDSASSLLNALNNDRHNGSLLDNLSNVLGGQSIDGDVLSDGAKILGHVFGGQEHNAAAAISKSSNESTDNVMNILKVVAPVILSYLGQKKSNNNITDSSGLDQLLGGLMGSESEAHQNAASMLQKFDQNDSTIGDLADLISGKGGNSGLGSLLGRFMK